MPTLIDGKNASVVLSSILDHYIHAFKQELINHAHTVNVPAPLAHPLIYQIVRGDGQYEITQGEEEKSNQLDARFLNIEQAIGELREQISEISGRVMIEGDVNGEHVDSADPAPTNRTRRTRDRPKRK